MASRIVPTTKSFPDIRVATGGRFGGAVLGLQTAMAKGAETRKFGMEQQKIDMANQLLGLKMQKAQQEQEFMNRIFPQKTQLGQDETTRQGIEEALAQLPAGVSFKAGPLTLAGQKYGETEVKTASGAEELLTELDDLKNIIKTEPKGKFATIPYLGKSAQAKGVKLPVIAPFGTTEKGQEYRTLRESINNRLLYLRSGAQINENEFRRLSGMLPLVFRSDKIDLQQLDRFENEFRNILGRIQKGYSWDKNKNVFTSPIKTTIPSEGEESENEDDILVNFFLDQIGAE